MPKSRENVYLLGDGKGEEKEGGGGVGGGSSRSWHCKRTRCNGFPVCEEWLTLPARAVQDEMQPASKQRAEDCFQV